MGKTKEQDEEDLLFMRDAFSVIARELDEFDLSFAHCDGGLSGLADQVDRLFSGWDDHFLRGEREGVIGVLNQLINQVIQQYQKYKEEGYLKRKGDRGWLGNLQRKYHDPDVWHASFALVSVAAEPLAKGRVPQRILQNLCLQLCRVRIYFRPDKSLGEISRVITELAKSEGINPVLQNRLNLIVRERTLEGLSRLSEAFDKADRFGEVDEIDEAADKATSAKEAADSRRDAEEQDPRVTEDLDAMYEWGVVSKARYDQIASEWSVARKRSLVAAFNHMNRQGFINEGEQVVLLENRQAVGALYACCDGNLAGAAQLMFRFSSDQKFIAAVLTLRHPALTAENGAKNIARNFRGLEREVRSGGGESPLYVERSLWVANLTFRVCAKLRDPDALTFQQVRLLRKTFMSIPSTRLSELAGYIDEMPEALEFSECSKRIDRSLGEMKLKDGKGRGISLASTAAKYGVFGTGVRQSVAPLMPSFHEEEGDDDSVSHGPH